MTSRSELDGALDALAAARASGARVADEVTGKRLVAALGIGVPAGACAENPADARAVAQAIGFPVAVKVARIDLPHKSDAGAVAGPLGSGGEVTVAAERLLALPLDDDPRLLVERWHTGGAGCFVGLTFDSEFGALVAFGAGGLWVEALRDVSYRMAPVTHRQAGQMIDRLRAAEMLRGARGQPPVDLDALAEVIVRFARLAEDSRARALLVDLEINPLLAAYEGPMLALDCTAVLRPAGGGGPSAPS